MMTLPRVIAVAALAGLFAVASTAQELARERLELTMELLPENAIDAQVITRRIELPPAAEPGSGQRPAELPGPPNAENGQGRETAAEARERGRDFGQDVAEQARENRDNAGRGDDPPGPPEDLPGPPADVPGAPGDNVPPGRP